MYPKEVRQESKLELGYHPFKKVIKFYDNAVLEEFKKDD